LCDVLYMRYLSEHIDSPNERNMSSFHAIFPEDQSLIRNVSWEPHLEAVRKFSFLTLLLERDSEDSNSTETRESPFGQDVPELSFGR